MCVYVKIIKAIGMLLLFVAKVCDSLQQQKEPFSQTGIDELDGRVNDTSMS